MKIILSLLFLPAALFSACSNTINQSQDFSTTPNFSPLLSPESEYVESVPFTARFEMYTNGTKRIFTQSMYHNLSPDLFIEASDPHLIQIKKAKLTWNDFFKTMPFTLTKECLVTGTKQTFCTSNTQKLRFLLNNQEVPEALDAVIHANDTLVVTYGQ